MVEVVNWQEVNNVWKKKRDEGKLTEEVELLSEERLAQWKLFWPGDWTIVEYKRLEQLYDNIMKTNNIVTAIQEDQAKKLCMFSLMADKKIVDNKDATREMKMYQDTIKSAGFEPKNARNYGDFESVGELMSYLVKLGFKPKFYDGNNRDEVDFTIKNQQSWLSRLVRNEPSIVELVEQRRDGYKVQQILEEEGMTDDELEAYDGMGMNTEWEDGDELFDAELDDEE